MFLQLAFPDAIYLVDAIQGGETVIEACKPALESSYITKVIHDCKRDSEVSYWFLLFFKLLYIWSAVACLIYLTILLSGIIFSVWHKVAQCCGYTGKHSHLKLSQRTWFSTKHHIVWLVWKVEYWDLSLMDY